AGGYNTFHVAESFLHAPETTRTEHSFLRLHTRTMKRLHEARNQMLVDNRCLTWRLALIFIALKSNSGRVRSRVLQMPNRNEQFCHYSPTDPSTAACSALQWLWSAAGKNAHSIDSDVSDGFDRNCKETLRSRRFRPGRFF